VSFTIRYRPNESIIGPVHVASFYSVISEAELVIKVYDSKVVITPSKRGAQGPAIEAEFDAIAANNNDILIAFIYSSRLRQARVVVLPGCAPAPADLDLGWLDANELV